jgi:hypothetical protein
VPVDLSHPASVHGVLAHSASHLSYLRNEETCEIAIGHKIESIRLVNEALSNPVVGLSDENVSAVLVLLTYEASP